MKSSTKKIAALAMLSALAYVVMLVGRISIVPGLPFLKYDPKDVIVVIGGFAFGPVAAFAISVVTSVLEIPVSSSGLWGCLMNILSTCAFAVTASLIYKKIKSIKGAVIGLLCGVVAATGVMMLWDYIVLPIYMGMPREAVVPYLIPSILPFNLLKAGINAALAFLLYKPFMLALRRSGLIEKSPEDKKYKFNIFVPAAALVIVTCVLIILAMNGII